MKKGSAMLYVILAVLTFSSIISYIFLKTSDVEIAQLTYINEINKFYDELYEQSYIDMQVIYVRPASE